MARVGVARSRLPVLAAVLHSGAGGIAADSSGHPSASWPRRVALYFVLAQAAHATHRDMGNAATPTLLFLLAVGAAALFGLAL